jgi:hypothetical protein
VSWGVAVFMANRLYVIVKYGSINVKGTIYSKAGTPIVYWLQMAIIAIGLALVGGIAVVVALGIAGFIK